MATSKNKKPSSKIDLKGNNAGYATRDRKTGTITYYKKASDAPGYNDTKTGKNVKTSAGKVLKTVPGPGAPTSGTTKATGTGATDPAYVNSQLNSIRSQAGVIQEQINQLRAGESQSNAGITSDSTDAVNGENAISENIKQLRERSGLDGEVDDYLDPIYKLQKEQRKEIERQRDALEQRRADEVAGIEEGFGVAKTDTENAQLKETGATSTALARAGGYLGVTASQQGVMQNLVITQRQELLALEAKKNEAIRAANNAYEDRDFELARELLKSARELETEAFNRRNTFFNQQLDIMGEERAQYAEQRASKEFKNKIVNERIDRLMDQGVQPGASQIATMAQELGISPDELAKTFEAATRTKALEDSKSRTARDVSIAAVLQSVPRDKTVVIDGVTYRGLGELASDSAAAAATATERERQRLNNVKAQFWDDMKGSIDPTTGKEIPPITMDEALREYPDLDLEYIQNAYNADKTAQTEPEVSSKIAAGEWDIIFSPSQKKSVVIDKAAYKKALEDWNDKTGDWAKLGEIAGDDDVIAYETLDGVTYKGPGIKIGDQYWSPIDPANFEVDKLQGLSNVTKY
jgi:uncharacterized protein (DUF433 family)